MQEQDDVKILELSFKDSELLSEVALKAYADHYLHLWYDRGQWYMQKYFSPNRLQEELKDDNTAFYIAYYNHAPVGFLKININAPLDDMTAEDAMELERIYLNKEVAGKGIGRQLVQLTFNLAKQSHKKRVWLKAMDTSEGPIAFYKKMGFEISGTHLLKHPLMKEELRGMVVMKKEL